MDKFKVWMMDFDIYPGEIDVLLNGGFNSYMAISCVSDEMVGKLFSNKDSIQKIRMAIYHLKKDIDKYNGSGSNSAESPVLSSVFIPSVPSPVSDKKQSGKVTKAESSAAHKVEKKPVPAPKAAYAGASKPSVTNSAPSPTLKSELNTSTKFISNLTKTTQGKRCKDCHDILASGHKDICDKECVGGFEICGYLKGHPEVTGNKKTAAKEVAEAKKIAKEKEKKELEEKKQFLEDALPIVELPPRPKEWVNKMTMEFLGTATDPESIQAAKKKAVALWIEKRAHKKAVEIARKEIKKEFPVQVLKERSMEELQQQVNDLIALRSNEYIESRKNVQFKPEDDIDEMAWE